MKQFSDLPLADDRYYEKRYFYDNIVSNIIFHDIQHHMYYDECKEDIFNSVCYVLEQLNRGVVVPIKLIDYCRHFLEMILKDDEFISRWSDTIAFEKSYSVILNHLKNLLAEELDGLEKKYKNERWERGSIRADNFIDELNFE